MRWIRQHKGYVLLCVVAFQLIMQIMTYINANLYTENPSLLFLEVVPRVIVLPILLFVFIRYDDYRKRRNRIIIAICYSVISIVFAFSGFISARHVPANSYFYSLFSYVIEPVIHAGLLLIFALRRRDNGDRWFFITCAITLCETIIGIIQIKQYTLIISWIMGIFTYCIAYLNVETKEEKVKTEYSYLEAYKQNMK